MTRPGGEGKALCDRQWSEVVGQDRRGDGPVGGHSHKFESCCRNLSEGIKNGHSHRVSDEIVVLADNDKNQGTLRDQREFIETDDLPGARFDKEHERRRGRPFEVDVAANRAASIPPNECPIQPI